MISNALLRLGRVAGLPTPPFEKPSPRKAFWVFEIAIPKKSKRPIQIIEKKISEVTKMIPVGSSRRLFIEYSGQALVLSIPESLIILLGEIDCSLEIYKALE